MHLYRYWGLLVASEMAWPELAPFRAPEALAEREADVVIHGPLGTALEPGADNRRTEVQPRWARLVVAQVAVFEVRDGHNISVTLAPGATLDAVQLFLFGSAWGLLCYQRGWLALHAGVVGGPGGALAVCGPSGSGKSTLVAGLVRRGHTLLSDDLCRVEVTASQAHVWPSLRRFKLWRETLEHFGEGLDGLVADLDNVDKFNLPAAAGMPSEPLPLKAIYLLEWGEFAAQRLSGADALRQFVAATLYRGEALAAMGRLPDYWRACAEVLRVCPVYRLRRPRQWSRLPEVLDWLALGEPSLTPPPMG